MLAALQEPQIYLNLYILKCLATFFFPPLIHSLLLLADIIYLAVTPKINMCNFLHKFYQEHIKLNELHLSTQQYLKVCVNLLTET